MPANGGGRTCCVKKIKWRKNMHTHICKCGNTDKVVAKKRESFQLVKQPTWRTNAPCTPFLSSLSARTYFTICFARQCGMSIVTRLHEYSAGLWADLWATTQGWSKIRKKTTTTRTKSKARSWKHKRMYEWMFAHLPTCRNNHQCHARRLERGYTHARAHPHTHTQAHSSSHSAARFACSYHWCTLIHSFLVINLPNSTPSSPSSTHAA